MPFTLKNPPTFSKNMPKAAQKIAIETFNAVFSETEDETKARMAAISNIKKEFKKVGDKWIPKSALIEVSMTITKATLQKDGSMRWQCVASEATRDKMGEFTSISLFQDWIERADNHIQVSFLPPSRQPFLGLSHYPDLSGLGEAGNTEQMYIDGNRFKASGFFYADSEHPLGKAVFDAVRREGELIQKGEIVEKPIRISAAWWDIAHSHGDFVFERKSINDICSMCSEGDKDSKLYLKGQLDHFAATRVPIHPATSLELEEKAAMTTRKEDANSIIGDPELIDKIDEEAKLLGKSETEESDSGLVIKAKTKTIDGKPRPAGDFLVVPDVDEPSDWSLPVKVDGKLDRRLMGAAWAALHKGFRGKKFEGPNKEEAISKLKKFYDQEGTDPPSVTKADLEVYEDILSEPDIQQMHMMYPGQRQEGKDQYGSEYDRDKYQLMRDEFELSEITHQRKMVDKFGIDFVGRHGSFATRSEVEEKAGDFPQGVAIANNEGEPNPGILPFGGAITIKEATNFIKANDMLAQSINRMDLFNTVVNNIFQFVSDPNEQVKLVKQATKDLSKSVAKIKNAVTDAILIQPLEQEGDEIMTEQILTNVAPDVERAEKELDPMQVPFDNAFRSIKKASKEEDQEKRKKLFGQAMSKLGRKVEQMFKGDVVDDMEGYIDLAVQRAMSPIAEQLGLISAKLGQQQAQVPVASNQPQQPQQKSFTPALIDPAGQQANQLPVSPTTGQPSQLRKIAMQKAGLL